MRSSAHLTVGSPTVRVAAILAATVLIALTVAGAGIAGTRLFAADDALVVDQSATDAFRTVTEAVAAAEDGDTILVRPGRYVESIPVVGKALTIRGDGDRDQIIVEAGSALGPTDDPEASPSNWAFTLLDSDTTLSNLTVIGQQEGTAIVVLGTSVATLDKLVINLLGEWTGDHSPVFWDADASGTLQNSIVEGYIGLASTLGVTIRDNELPATCIIQQDPGARITVVHNTIHGCPYEFGIRVLQGSATIEGNDIWIEAAPPGSLYLQGRIAILIASADGDVIVRDNQVHDSVIGIQVAQGARAATIAGNSLTGNETSLRISGDSVMVGNTVTGSQLGVALDWGSPTLQGNTITGNGQGLLLSGSGDPVLTGNSVCDNGTNVVLDGAPMPDISGNDICKDAPAA